MQSLIHEASDGFLLQIPYLISQQLNFRNNTSVDLVVENGHLSVYPIKKYNLKKIMTTIKPDDFADPWPDDTIRGQELL